MPPFLLYLTNCLTCPIIYNEPAEIIISSSCAFSNVYLTASSIFGIAITSETYFSIFSFNSSQLIALSLSGVVVITLSN